MRGLVAPRWLRRLAPDGLRDNPRLRAVALATGLIPPRQLHSAAEAAALARLASTARCAVEIGVHEGSSAVALGQALPAGAELHLVDPFVDASGWALPRGWQATPWSTRRVVRRHLRGTRVNVRWHVARSQDIGRSWSGPQPDLVFVDGDHEPGAVREDWDVWHPHVARGGSVAFHDARLDRPEGNGSPGPTNVVDALFRSPGPPNGWALVHEVDTLVVIQRVG